MSVLCVSVKSMVIAMTRLPKSPVLSLCLIALAGFGAYVPLEKIRSAQIESASQPLAVNALLPELQSRGFGESTSNVSASADLVLDGERVIDTKSAYLADLSDKTL